MAMAVKEESSGSSSRSPPLSSPSPPRVSVPEFVKDSPYLAHPKYTPRTMRRRTRKQASNRNNSSRALRFPSTGTGTALSEPLEVLPPEGLTHCQEETKNNSATTSDYGTLSVNNLAEIDSILSNSMSNISLLGEEKDPQDTRLEILRINSEAFVLYPSTTYNLRSCLSVNLTDESCGDSLKTNSLMQVCETIEVTKYNLNKPAIYCMTCYHPRVHIFKRLFTNFIHNQTVKVRNNLLVFRIDSPGTYAVFKSRKDPVIDYIRLNPRKSASFRLTKDPKDPIIEVIFDKGCVEKRTKLKGQVFFEELHFEEEYLASPVISLSPHGSMFDKEVQIRIEILKVPEVGEFSDRDLRLYVDRRNYEDTWSPLNDFKLVTDENSRKFVEFQVRHFSLFKVLWSGVKKTGSLGSGLISSLLGRSAATVESFQMKCQVSMDEFENNHFGLEVCVFSAEKASPEPEVVNYTHVVGKSLSKTVKAGKLTVLLKSNLFRADTEAGEEEEMVKEENDFNGNDFCCNFLLVFNENIRQRTGPFGKVFVSRQDEQGDKETIFEINIQKLVNEVESNPSRRDRIRDPIPGTSSMGASNVDQWSTLPLEDLANNLGYDQEDHEYWKSLAKSLGFSKADRKRFKLSGAPLKALNDAYKARGGQSRDFINLLYDAHVSSGSGAQASTSRSPMTSSPSPGRVSQSASSGFGSRSSRNVLYNGHHNTTSSSSSSSNESEDEAIAGGSRDAYKHRHDYSSEPRSSRSKRKRSKSKHSKDKRNRKNKKRKRKHSSSSSSSLSSSVSSDHRSKTKSSRHESDKNLEADTRKLSEGFLWELTIFLTNSHWKALGRTLQIEESQLTAIATAHNVGNRELYYQMLLVWKEKYPAKFTFGTLYSALVKENMCAVAKKMDEIYKSLQRQNK